MTSLILITTTNDDRVELETIAKMLIDRKLAACCQISSEIESIYQWKNMIESNKEWVCSIKTIKQHFEAIEKVICEHHHYDLPQIVAVDITMASETYMNWVRDSVK